MGQLNRGDAKRSPGREEPQEPGWRLFLQSHGGRTPTGAGDLFGAPVPLVGQKERRTFLPFGGRFHEIMYTADVCFRGDR
jgi:hypothetical protein